MSRSLRIVIIGGGIAGLTAANALRQRGFNDVRIYERSADLGEVGAGVQIGPNAVKVLRALDLEAAVARESSEVTNMVSIKWDDGSLRFRDRMQDCQAQFGARYYLAHRADLHRILAAGVPPAWIHLASACTSVVSYGNVAMARFANGAEVEADLVIGADGIRSAVRESLFGPDRARYTAQMGWRGMLPIDCVPAKFGPNRSVSLGRDEYCGWIGPTGHVICYPIRRGELYNIWTGYVSEEWVEESWTVPSQPSEMMAAFAGWHDALLEMLGKIDRCYKLGIYDRDPLPTWTKGRTTLIGDAAHPMMPTLAQGAAISIEDGFVLARHLAANRNDPVHALAGYDSERVPRATKVQLQARQQFENNRKTPTPPPLDRNWIFAHDATIDAPVQAPALAG